MTIEGVQEQVDISADTGVSTDPANNAGATVLKEKELEALPDDPDELEAALQALAGLRPGRTAARYTSTVLQAGFSSKMRSEKIRINSNPFSASSIVLVPDVSRS